MSEEEVKFRYDVYGGSAHNFVNMNVNQYLFMNEVETTLLWFFGLDYKLLFPHSCKNICSMFSLALKSLITEDYPAIVNNTYAHLAVIDNKFYCI